MARSPGQMEGQLPRQAGGSRQKDKKKSKGALAQSFKDSRPIFGIDVPDRVERILNLDKDAGRTVDEGQSTDTRSEPTRTGLKNASHKLLEDTESTPRTGITPGSTDQRHTVSLRKFLSRGNVFHLCCSVAQTPASRNDLSFSSCTIFRCMYSPRLG
jgi:hypothetical protein